MPILHLYPGPVTSGGASAAITGTGNQWADDSDATYARFTGSDLATAELPPLGIDPALVKAITWNFRADGTSTDPDGSRMGLRIQDPDSFAHVAVDDGPEGAGWHVTSTATDYSTTPNAANYAGYGLTLSEVADWLALGATLTASQLVTLGYSGTATAYEFWLTVTYGATAAPPLRQYPRSDGLATSSARRMWPPSRSYQRSNRRAGGYL